MDIEYVWVAAHRVCLVPRSIEYVFPFQPIEYSFHLSLAEFHLLKIPIQYLLILKNFCQVFIKFLFCQVSKISFYFIKFRSTKGEVALIVKFDNHPSSLIEWGCLSLAERRSSVEILLESFYLSYFHLVLIICKVLVSFPSLLIHWLILV